VFPVRHGINFCILFGINSVFECLINIYLIIYYFTSKTTVVHIKWIPFHYGIACLQEVMGDNT
jgi:hypothetical protein